MKTPIVTPRESSPDHSNTPLSSSHPSLAIAIPFHSKGTAARKRRNSKRRRSPAQLKPASHRAQSDAPFRVGGFHHAARAFFSPLIKSGGRTHATRKLAIIRELIRQPTLCVLVLSTLSEEEKKRQILPVARYSTELIRVRCHWLRCAETTPCCSFLGVASARNVQTDEHASRPCGMIRMGTMDCPSDLGKGSRRGVGQCREGYLRLGYNILYHVREVKRRERKRQTTTNRDIGDDWHGAFALSSVVGWFVFRASDDHQLA